MTTRLTPTDLRRRVAREGRRRAYAAFVDGANRVARRGRLTWPEVRAMRVLLEWQMSRPLLAADPSTHVEPVRARHAGRLVKGEWVESAGINTRDTSVIVYVHGGAFVAGSPKSHRGLVAEVSRRTSRSVFSVEYRLAPEHTFPTAADDVLRAYEWVMSSGVAADRIVLVGDSAGGHLVLGMPPRAVRAGLPVPAGVVAFSPVVDLSMELSGAYDGDLVPGVDAPGAGRAALSAYHSGTPVDHPELMLTNDDLSVMPPVLIQASASEILAADAKHYVEGLRAAGGTGELRLWPRKYHVFQVGFRVSKAAAEALGDVASFVERVVRP